MKNVVALTLAAALFSLAGCSTLPVTEAQAKPVPSERVYLPQYLQKSAERSATIYISRDKGYFGSGCSHDIYLNNEKVMAIRQAEAATLHVVPGAYFLKLETGGGLCPNISTSQNLTLGAGERQVYRLLLPSDGNLRLTRDQ
ncbi:hypothetical protein [Stenotrophomonas lactitubi]|uniref:hypothetical protein n=1 Tax=Stenotrophomonas lactitubi TaxID=2045214 RepID=UPI001DD0E99E|nr:hypothetical protein [Stenotrophomonas lactitubi]CAH0229368.1 hypothetical protein SRABI35_02418 [Stenotrophomonas lactitubi]